MKRARDFALLLLMTALGSALYFKPIRAGEITPATPAPGGAAAPQQPDGQRPNGNGTAKLFVTVGKSLIIDSPIEIRRVSVANGILAEAVAVNPKEVLINGLAPGETSLIVWQQNGSRLVYDLTVRISMVRLDAARSQIARDFPNDNINLTFENDTAFLRGRVKDVTAADRVVAIAMTLGKVVNLLTVDVPGIEPQVVLKVKFANIDRSASTEYGFNFFNGSFNQQSSIGTGSPVLPDEGGKFSVSSLVNILLFRPDINLVAAIQALQAKRVLELLAEPNLLAISGQAAEFLAGGEFPFPIVQPGAGTSAISLAFREYGIRLSFVPTVTPRGTIRMKIAPEVSSLDYNSAVTVQGVTVPGLSSRRVNTTVELESGQSFVIAGLLDHQTRESFSKVPGISKIPVLGKLFESKVTSRANSELIVIITPEVVRPIPAGQPTPDLPFSSGFMSNRQNASPVSHPGQDKTGPVPITPPVDGLPVEMLRPKPENTGNAAPMFQMIPVQATTSQEAPPVNPGIATKPPGAPR